MDYTFENRRGIEGLLVLEVKDLANRSCRYRTYENEFGVLICQSVVPGVRSQSPISGYGGLPSTTPAPPHNIAQNPVNALWLRTLMFQ